MSSDFYASWVERHKYEDDGGRWWWTGDHEEVIDGPYTEEALDAVLAGDAAPSAP